MTAAHWSPWPLRGLVGDLQSGAASPAGAAARARSRVGATEPDLQAWTVPPGPSGAPDSPGGALHGVPLGVKDIIDVAGMPTRCGSPLRADAAPAGADAAIVAAWRRAGAAPAGKTATTEFAFFAPAPTRNPVATAHTPGGSSSGSAAAVAAGQVPLALGSQTAGSVIRPASFCGVAALVMTHGRFPTSGVVGLSPSLDSHGVYAAGVSDLALAWSALTGGRDVGLAAQRPPRVLLWGAGPLGAVQPAMRRALETAADRLEQAGARVQPMPAEAERLVAELAAAHPVVMAYEAARERAAELARADRLSEQLAGLLRTGAATPEADYAAASALADRARARIAALLAGHDAILGPAAPGAAPLRSEGTGDPLLSRPWQLLGLPAVAVPGLRAGDGLPLGVQLVGRAGGEEELIAAALAAEAALAG
ncbi:amidase family protein [Nocardiopsis coralliicola]